MSADSINIIPINKLTPIFASAYVILFPPYPHTYFQTYLSVYSFIIQQKPTENLYFPKTKIHHSCLNDVQAEYSILYL
ncbi:hypothetical protein EMIT079MI2_30287 [Bacillus sp. IT-79MI2]